MGRVDHGHAAATQDVDRPEKGGDLVVGQRGRRLVHQDDVRLPGQGLGDLDDLDLRDGEGAHRQGGIELGIEGA